ncbi:ATP-binding protein [Paenibacillus roseipurpureus]|uniref:Uncharacterized protein n=1 Tax=Paenibacillus roseopurpureus TaxID=2918901 RepID=A0AA96RMY4_9BACL|nr:hypothetical protein [Paenibacillus sp. MBLB1832]WNR47165.1 hypothetical protein MJB10_03965 [Paenibacillus sp. MBLB1832]
MVKNKTKLFTVLGISAVLLVGGASAYAANTATATPKQVTEVVPVQTTDKVPTPQEIEAVLKGEPTPATIKVEGLFSRDGKPDYSADFFLNDEKLTALLKMSAAGLGLAISKNILELHGVPYGAANTADGVLFFFYLHVYR